MKEEQAKMEEEEQEEEEHEMSFDGMWPFVGFVLLFPRPVLSPDDLRGMKTPPTFLARVAL